MYKSQILSFIEYRTAAIYHACQSALDLLDDIQEKVLKVTGASKVEALNEMNLAPLSVRRDIAMLGIIHCAVIGRGPDQFREFSDRAPPPCPDTATFLLAGRIVVT